MEKVSRQGLQAREFKARGLGHGGLTSSSESSARRRQRDRMSPTAGPPTTRTISAVLPPSSETGSTYATLFVRFRSCPAFPRLHASASSSTG